MTREEILENYPDGEFMFADGWDDAIIGIDAKNMRVVYDANHIMKKMEVDGMTEEEAQEFFDFNIVGAYMGEQTPIYVYI